MTMCRTGGSADTQPWVNWGLRSTRSGQCEGDVGEAMNTRSIKLGTEEAR